MEIISITDLKTGEVDEHRLGVEKKQKRYTIRGNKMYDKGLIKLLNVLTNKEIIRLVEWHDDIKTIGYNNIFNKKFNKITEDMSPAVRSRFKKKLITNEVVHEIAKDKLMLNPYMFLPRPDKNIADSQYLAQQYWTMMTKDKDLYVNGLPEFAEMIHPVDRKQATRLKIKDQWYDAPEQIEE